jgi:hypothetical protein
MKTVLAPGAPWPTYDKNGAVVKPTPPPKKKVVVARTTKIQNTNRNFELWLKRTS